MELSKRVLTALSSLVPVQVDVRPEEIDIGILLYCVVYRDYVKELMSPPVEPSVEPDAGTSTECDCCSQQLERDLSVVTQNAGSLTGDHYETSTSEPCTPVVRRPQRIMVRSLSISHLASLLSPCRTPLKAFSSSTWSSRRRKKTNNHHEATIPSITTATRSPTAPQTGWDSTPVSPVSTGPSAAALATTESEEEKHHHRHQPFILPPQEAEAIKALKAALVRANVVLSPGYLKANYDEPEVSILHRFLLARDYDIERAKHMLREDIRWREEFEGGLVDFQDRSLEEVVGIPQDAFEEHYWSQFLVYDEEDNHCPVFYRSLSGMRTWELLKHMTVDTMVKHQLWEFEQHQRYLFHHPPCFPCRQVKYILSIKGMDWPQLTKDLLAILGGFSDVSKLHHPERLKQLYIVDAPWAFGVAWSLLTPFIPVKTREKIGILTSPQADAHPVVSKCLKRLKPPKGVSR